MNTKHYSSIDEFYQAVTDFCLERAQQAVASYGQFALVLAGGSTPMPLYRKLTEESRFPWNKTHLFWGDERCVPHDSELNNYHNTINALGGAGFIPNENIHRIKSELTPADAVADYRREIASFRKKRGDGLCFDLILLGMGNDGHTASLFPGSPALAEQDALVVAVPAPSTSAPCIPRITMTYPAFEAAATIAVMITGKQKQSLLKQIDQEPKTAGKYPISKIKAQKELIWFVA
ncbi:MAG: 6-phosphogluconolactonase [Victivallaceae bacterium]|nr:6-phosphogluconolactonase [Victivallaceae bacterium]